MNAATAVDSHPILTTPYCAVQSKKDLKEQRSFFRKLVATLEVGLVVVINIFHTRITRGKKTRRTALSTRARR